MWVPPIRSPWSLSSPTNDNFPSCCPSSNVSRAIVRMFSSSPYSLRFLARCFNIVFITKVVLSFQGLGSSTFYKIEYTQVITCTTTYATTS
jgi:hypothetical protein